MGFGFLLFGYAFGRMMDVVTIISKYYCYYKTKNTCFILY